jgi:hypothetical protein
MFGSNDYSFGKPPLERSQSTPQLTLKTHQGQFRYTQMKAQKRSQSVKHLSPNTVRKTVRFSSLANVAVRPVSKQKLCNLWLQPEEYSKIEEGRRQCLYTVKKALLGRAPPPDPSEYSVRGLEQQLSSKQVMERKIKNMHYRKLLLEEQSVQRQYGVSDPQALQSLSELFSQASVRKAHGRAKEALCADRV